MYRFFLLSSFLLLLSGFAKSQVDSLPKRDSVIAADSSQMLRDSLAKDSLRVVLADTSWKKMARQYPGGSFFSQVFHANKFFAFDAQPIIVRSNRKEFHGKETLFYSLITVLLFFSFIRMAFPKYLADLFRLTFRTTIKQRQVGEQLIQTPLPSLLLNIFFLVIGGFYIAFVLQYYRLASEFGFWLLFLYSMAGLALIYSIKFVSLKLSGAMFSISDVTDAYIFTVFLINKIIGIFLLPVVILLAFTNGNFYNGLITLSYIGLGGLYLYRFILSYGLVRNQIKVNPFHFFLYLVIFEIIPLLLIYKLLLLWLK